MAALRVAHSFGFLLPLRLTFNRLSLPPALNSCRLVPGNIPASDAASLGLLLAFSAALVTTAHFLLTTVNDITSTLGIDVFSIEKQLAKAAAAKQQGTAAAAAAGVAPAAAASAAAATGGPSGGAGAVAAGSAAAPAAAVAEGAAAAAAAAGGDAESTGPAGAGGKKRRGSASPAPRRR